MNNSVKNFKLEVSMFMSSLVLIICLSAIPISFFNKEIFVFCVSIFGFSLGFTRFFISLKKLKYE